MKKTTFKIISLIFGILAISSGFENAFVIYFLFSGDSPQANETAYLSGKITFTVLMLILMVFFLKKSKKINQPRSDIPLKK